MKKIKIIGERAGGRYAIVDDEDFDMVSKYRWHLYGKCLIKFPYARAYIGEINKKTCYINMHRLIIGRPEGMVIDHINNNTLDNRKCNLRVCTMAQNSIRRKANKKTGFKGVSFNKKNNRFIATCFFNKERIYIGCFINKEDAAIAYNKKVFELYGEFAFQNVVNKNLQSLREPEVEP